MVRVGIIGFGFMGQTHWRCYEKLSSAAKVVAVADIDPARAAGDTTGTWGNMGDGPSRLDFTGVFGTQDYQELLKRSDVDVVDICVPTQIHAQIALAAIAAGKHVLCEKPLARTLEQAREIAQAAAKAKSFFMPAMCMRFWPQWSWLKQAIADGRYGKVKGASFLRQGSTPRGWFGDGKLSGGAVLDLHIHDTDFVCHLFGKPKAVSSKGYSLQTGEIDHLVTQYHYDDIPMVVADGGWSFASPYPFKMRYSVTFDSGVTADFDLGGKESLVVYHNGKAEPIKCEEIDGWLGEIRYFVDCVAKNTRPTLVTAEDGLIAMQVIEAEKRSIASGQVQTV